jgi:uncharacterized protein (TIGR02611 family)
VADPSQVLRFVVRNTKRMLVMIVGLLLVAAGLALLVLPGPGLVLIIAGLAVLATEFAWAERVLDSAKRRAADAGKVVRGRVRRGSHAGPADEPASSSGGAAAGTSDRPA